jgi:peptidoglycan/xylan/chitin deacetylase (PgdA/CDA1 family)
MKIAKTLARQVVFPTFFALGLDGILLKKALGHGVILVYHGVSYQDLSWLNGRHLMAAEFDAHMAYLAKNFRVVSVVDFFNLYRNRAARTMGKPYLTITFDDGFINNLEIALPILEKYSLPASIYAVSVSTQNAKALLWADLVELIQSKQPNGFSVGNENFTKSLGRWTNNTGLLISDFIKQLPYNKRDILLEEARTRYAIDQYIDSLPAESYQLMNTAQLKAIANHPLITIGSHSHLHYNLANLTDEQIYLELKTSKDLLEQATGKVINEIAYPDGSYDDRVKDIAEKVGYLYQLAVNYRLPDDSADKRILPRFGISNTTTTEANMLKMLLSKKEFSF